MREKLIEKLRWHLSYSVHWTQPDVVYALVQVRKLLDPFKNNKPHPYPSLRMHCDWAVHTELTGYEATRLVRQMDDYLTGILSKKEKSKPVEQNEIDRLREMLSIFKLKRLKEELGRFLRDNDLPLNLVSNNGEWIAFQRSYIGAVDGCPLWVRDENGLKAINKLILKTPNILLVGSQQVPAIWDIYFKDGTKIPVSGDLA